jgi:hypothetical protein
MYGKTASAQKGKQSRSALFDAESSDEFNEDSTTQSVSSASSEEWWRIEFNRYLNRKDELPEKTSLVQWWGVS